MKAQEQENKTVIQSHNKIPNIVVKINEPTRVTSINIILKSNVEPKHMQYTTDKVLNHTKQLYIVYLFIHT